MGSWIYGASSPDFRFSMSNPSLPTNATTSSSVNSTAPGSAMPRVPVSGGFQLETWGTRLSPPQLQVLPRGHVYLERYSRSAIVTDPY